MKMFDSSLDFTFNFDQSQFLFIILSFIHSYLIFLGTT